MQRERVTSADVERILEPLLRRSHLARMAALLAIEADRLTEENRQLRAAVRIYRELLTRAQEAKASAKH